MAKPTSAFTVNRIINASYAGVLAQVTVVTDWFKFISDSNYREKRNEPVEFHSLGQVKVAGKTFYVYNVAGYAVLYNKDNNSTVMYEGKVQPWCFLMNLEDAKKIHVPQGMDVDVATGINLADFMPKTEASPAPAQAEIDEDTIIG